jgi:DNA processing protein
MLMVDPHPYWIGFNLVKGIGAVRLRALLDSFGSVEAAWNAPAESLAAVGLNAKIVENMLQIRAGVSLEKIWQNLQAQGIQVFTWDDETYPARLRDIDPSPPVIYINGELLPEDDWAVAVVGTRRITAYGRQVTEQIAHTLAHGGVTVVSGLARGVDAVAHRVALDCGGRTIAVLGSGIDRIYPPEHRKLAEEIRAHGALISNYAPGTPPEATNFPPRNRIISGLSRATVVVEAGIQSGALLTAQFAAEQGREVFAVPGSVLTPQSRGTNRLIQNGATPLLEPQELLDALDLNRVAEQRVARTVLPANATEAQLYALLGSDPLHVDEIRLQTNLPIEQVTATLALMELKGMVNQVGGMRYVAVREPEAYYGVDNQAETAP